MGSQSRTLIIGCGGAGCNVVDFIRHSDAFTHEMMAIKIDPNENKSLDIKIPKIQQVNDVIVVCGLGGNTGGELTPNIISIIKKFNVSCKAITIFPFKFEGNNRNRIAKNQLELIANSCDTLYTISNENQSQSIGRQNPKVSLLEFFNHINKEVLSFLTGDNHT